MEVVHSQSSQDKEERIKLMHVLLFGILFLGSYNLIYYLSKVLGFSYFLFPWYKNRLPAFCLFVFILVLYKPIRRFTVSVFSFFPLKKGETYLYIVGGFFILYYAHLLLFDNIGSSYLRHRYINYVIIYFLNKCLLVPVLEEMLFRGILYRSLVQKTNVWVSVVGTSVLFGLFHPEYILFGFILGVVFTAAYQLTRSLWPAIILHSLWNLFTVTAYEWLNFNPWIK